LFDKNLRIW